uniref:ATP synthase subunit a n=1 Tax=Clavaria fumosa TaxID=264083 RepID=A0A7T3U4Y5_9AGAR|nr:ATP synthase F0 subunit a [Clavaria fumosa]QPZ51086.1 ATP synthase F0 subunit a [Clavaria fumosa]
MITKLSNLFIFSPLEQFEVTSLLSFNAPILGHISLTLTNLALYSLLILFLILGLHYMGNNETKLLPSKWSISLESLFSSINSMVREQIGTSNEIYLPFIYSLFCFVLFANLLGNVPYSFVITTSAIVCLGLSFTIFIGVTLLGLSIHKLNFFSFFVPSGCPLILVPMLSLIEFVSYVSRSVSLGVRLFANLVAGHSLVKILSTFLYKLFSSSILMFIITLLPFTIFITLTGLELAVSVIQTYVFCLLVSSYLKDAIELH